jgi:hypothetical protein
MHRAKTLAASFVVISVLPGCRKTMGHDPDPESARDRSASVFRADNGNCELIVPMSCPKGASCNPPPPDIIDCPANKRDAGEPAGPTRRPPGKEDWLRVKPQLWVGAQCEYVGERFCAPPGKPFECTAQSDRVTVPCAAVPPDGGVDASPAIASSRYQLESFVYKDGVGACHRIAAMTCGTSCAAPEGDPAPCPQPPP